MKKLVFANADPNFVVQNEWPNAISSCLSFKSVWSDDDLHQSIFAFKTSYELKPKFVTTVSQPFCTYVPPNIIIETCVPNERFLKGNIAQIYIRVESRVPLGISHVTPGIRVPKVGNCCTILVL